MGVPASLGVSASGKSPYGVTDRANGVVQGTIAGIGPQKPLMIQGPMNLWIYCDFTATLNTTAGSLSATAIGLGASAVGMAVNSTLVPKGTTIGTYADPAATLLVPILTYYGKIVNGVPQITDLEETRFLVGATVTGYGIPAATTVSAIATTAIQPDGNSIPGSPGRRGVVTLSAAVNAAPPNDSPIPFEFQLAAGSILTTGADAAATFTSAGLGLTGTVQLEQSFDGGATWVAANVGSAGAIAVWNVTTPVSIAFGQPEFDVLLRLNCLTLTPVAGVALKYRISATGQAATTVAVPAIM